jgi:hypothetical protein
MTIGISLPINYVKMIDEQKGDSTRSRYIMRAIERTLQRNGGVALTTPPAPNPAAELQPNEGVKAT